MTPLSFRLVVAVVVTVASVHTFAGTLDDAPFRVVVPNGDWKVDDSASQDFGKNVFLVATISKTNTLLKSAVVKGLIKKITKLSLEEYASGIRDSMANPAVKKISEVETTFLGYKAKKFIYELKGDQTTYNEAIVFISEKAGWTILGTGPAEQKGEIKQIFDFYQKKAP